MRKLDLTAFPEIREAKYTCHKAFLLIVASGDTKDILSLAGNAQQQMSEIVKSVLYETVIPEGVML